MMARSQLRVFANPLVICALMAGVPRTVKMAIAVLKDGMRSPVTIREMVE